MSTSLQVISDLHLEVERSGASRGREFYHYDIEPRAPHLALLGDIGWTLHDELFVWLEKQLAKFETVFFVPGNHEPYRSSLPASLARLDEFATKHASRFVLLNRTRHDLSPTLTILGCTLWTRLDPDELDILSWSLTDFKHIDEWTPAAFSAQHAQDLAWLNASVANIARDDPERTVVVLTHHAPTVAGTSPPQFTGQLTNSAFATELTREPCWDPRVVRLWAFGHTHFSCDFVRNGVRVFSNQRGYKDGEGAFDPAKVVLV